MSKKIIIGTIASTLILGAAAYFTIQNKITNEAKIAVNKMVESNVFKSYDSISCNGVLNTTCVLTNVITEQDNVKTGAREYLKIKKITTPSLTELSKLVDKDGNFQIGEKRKVRLTLKFEGITINDKSPIIDSLHLPSLKEGSSLKKDLTKLSKEEISIMISTSIDPIKESKGFIESTNIKMNIGNSLSIAFKENMVISKSIKKLKKDMETDPLNILKNILVKNVSISFQTSEQYIPNIIYGIYKDKINEAKNMDSATKESVEKSIENINFYFVRENDIKTLLDQKSFMQKISTTAKEEFKKNGAIPSAIEEDVTTRFSEILAGTSNSITLGVENTFNYNLMEYASVYMSSITSNSPIIENEIIKKTKIIVK